MSKMHSTIELFSGFVAGCTTTLICQPIDRVKVRRQVEIGCVVGSGRSFEVMNEIWASEGLYGFYRGFVPNLVGNASCWALYFMWYEMAKSYASSFRGEKNLNPVDYLLASASSSVFTSICTNPIWVMKTRMLAHKPGSTATPSSWLRETKLILYHDGIGGLYRGLVPSLLGVPQYAIQFSVYEQLKIWRARSRETLSSLDIGILSATSKLFAGALMYPHQVLRSKIQNSQIGCRLSTWSLAKTIRRKEGFRGFYRGIVPTLLRNIPSTCVTFVVFENINSMMRSRDSEIVEAI